MIDIEKLEREHAEKIAAAKAENAFRDRLIALGVPEPRSVFFHPATRNGHRYSHWSISYGDSYSAGPKVDPETLALLADRLPGLPLVWHSGGALGSSVTAQIDRDNDDREARTEGPAAPWWCSTGYGGETCLNWYSEVDGVRVHVACVLPLDLGHAVGGVNARRVEFKGGFCYENVCLRRCADRLYTIFDADGVPVAEFGGPGCWVYASGSPDTLGNAMLTWTPIDADRAPSVADFVRQLCQ